MAPFALNNTPFHAQTRGPRESGRLAQNLGVQQEAIAGSTLILL